MDTLVTEHNNRLFLTAQARVVDAADEVAEEYASTISDWQVDKSNPYVKWISGSYVESDNPNSNGQFWNSADLEFGEYSIKYAPLNMLHKVRRPVGFYLATKRAFYNEKQNQSAAVKDGPFKIEALSGMWSHLFPFESALVDQANEKGLLYYSMECRSEQVTCAGQSGCGQTFAYEDAAAHCVHLKERASVRHLVNPTFRGGALIIPPVQPGWKNATAEVMEAASLYAEQTEDMYAQAKATSDIDASSWEALMASIVQMSQA